ncbi:MAG: hypothetical protein ACYC8T_02155 [Myxococcaceae bacterium]
MRATTLAAFSAVAVLGLSFGGCKCDPEPIVEEEDGGGGEDAGDGGDGGDDGGLVDGGGADAGDLPDGGTCIGAGSPCEASRPCCSGSCAGAVCISNTFCRAAGGSCSGNVDCCLNNCQNGTCAPTACSDVGAACTAGGQCCTQTCTAGACAVLPAVTGTGQCKVLGQACASRGECCSYNCQGGFCLKAYYCQPNGDICTSSSQCCGQSCSANDGGPGRCQFVTGGGGGGCAQEGNPCDSNLTTMVLPDGGLALSDGGALPTGGVTPAGNCCSRICFDPGSGTSVCLPAGGCRLTGTFCSATSQCCGGAPAQSMVECQDAPSGRCDNGQSCNGVGNICGAAVLPDGGKINASQNCCDGPPGSPNQPPYRGCRLDSSGIPRCFGGCPGGVCDGTCPNGYTGVEPCCIAQGVACQFKDQCCNGAPCLPSGDGGLVCGVTVSCLPVGASCAADAGSCCLGTNCLATGELSGEVCQNPSDAGITDGGPVCKGNGSGCAVNNECCSSLCTLPGDGGAGVCQPPGSCQPQGGICTATGDCCTGTQCIVPPGQVSGTCQVSTCAGQGQACSGAANCCGGLTCLDAANNLCSGTGSCTCQVIIG